MTTAHDVTPYAGRDPSLRRREGRRLQAAVAATALALVAAVPACGDDVGERPAGSASSTVQEEHEEMGDITDVELAARAYVAGYPLVVTVRTLQRLGGLAAPNQLVWQSSLSGPENRAVVAPNRDTLYSFAVLDLRSEPMVLTLPEVTDRYYAYQLLDAWTESFAYLGTRATGGRAGRWLITPPGWDGDVPNGMEQIEAPTPQLFLLGRFLVDDEADVANVTAISERSSLEPLSVATGEETPPPPPPLGEPASTPQDVPTGARFFDELGDALAVNPATTDVQRELFARAEALGIGAGLHPSQEGDGDLVAVLDEGAAMGAQRIGDRAQGRGSDADDVPASGWALSTDVGRYGDDMLLRAVVARVGWGANVPEEALYAIARVDGDGNPFGGDNTYRLRFGPGELPPVDAFWSLTVYGSDMFFVEHPSGRYAIGDRTPGLVTGDDGSLDVVLSHRQPPAGPDGEPVNWLPVPEGPFVVMLRLYLPQQEVIAGQYELPPIEWSRPADAVVGQPSGPRRTAAP